MEMLKSNALKTASLLTYMWCTIGHTRIVPVDWLRRILFPLYKGKGEQANPQNSYPLTILSHVCKITEKAVVLELEKVVTTDKLQFGFQAGLQVEQAALSILAALKTVERYISILDLSKTYDSMIKALLFQKIQNKVDRNLANHLSIILFTIQAQVSGDITKTTITMRIGLTQVGRRPRPCLNCTSTTSRRNYVKH